MLEVELPYPPSINHYWRHVRGRTIISREGRRFRERVTAILAARRTTPIAGPLEVEVDVFPPDRRRRDLDNVQKALLDAMQYGGAYGDDSQIDDLHVRRRDCLRGGMVLVKVGPRRDEPPLAGVATQARPRSCLKCGKVFNSSGPGNRICGACQRSNDRLRLGESAIQKQRGVKRHNGDILPTDLEALS